MLHLTLLFVIAIAIARNQVSISAPNVGAKCNGFGCIDEVVARTADAPMAYRVLFPFILRYVPKKFKLFTYQLALVVGAWLLLGTMSKAFGPLTAVVFGLLVSSTFRFDYWDWIFEVQPFMDPLGFVHRGLWHWCSPERQR